MNTEKLTAVEWYEKQIFNLLLKLENKEISLGEYAVCRVELFGRAKTLEKEQMCKFAYKCHNHYKVNGDFKIEQYYNSTFKSE